jgi:hypothetical protein
MSDAVEMGMDNYGSEDDVEKAYQEVCDEVGVEIGAEIKGVGRSKVGSKQKAGGTNDLEARLNKLK